jgi:hypothetical protein
MSVITPVITNWGMPPAAPLVAGIAGLILSVNPNLTKNQVRDILKDTADKIGSSTSYDASGHSNEYGYGRVNALAAVQNAKPQGGGSPAATSSPTITGPASQSRTSGGPTFQISPGKNHYYAVEVATASNLFDQSGSGSERNDSNFYASWSDTALLDASTYTLPDNVWSKLKSASSLYYRILTSSSASDWVDFEASTPDSEAASAPSIQITEGTAVPAPTGGLSISGQSSHDRTSGGPTFTISIGNNSYYAVEAAASSDLFDQAAHGSERTDSNFYGSWSDTALMSELTYTLPDAAWERLKSADSLYYRLLTSSSASDWVDFEVSTPDSEASTAPSILLTGDVNRSALKSRTIRQAVGPWITGPERYDRGANAPEFAVMLGDNRFYAVEVTTDAKLFLASQFSAERTADNFFSSLQEGAIEANRETVYTLSADIWHTMRSAPRLFYRVLTSSVPSTGRAWACSTPDEQYDSSPWMNLTGGVVSKSEIAAQDVEIPRYGVDHVEDERLWHNR